MAKVRSPLFCALPAILLSALCLAPFLHKAYTIDDPIFLEEARQILRDPLRPAAFDIVWDGRGDVRPLRIVGPPSVLGGYALVPAILLGGAEWAGHLSVWLLLVVALWSTSSIALRLGCSARAATLACILVVATPPVLVMTSTVMPDILAMTLGVIGIEQLLAWKQERLKWQGIAAALALGLAPMARLHLLLMYAVGALLLCENEDPRISPLPRWLPLLTAPLIFLAAYAVTFDTPRAAPTAGMIGTLPKYLVSLANVRENLRDFGFFWVSTIPLALGWLLVRRSPWPLLVSPFLVIWAAINRGHVPWLVPFSVLGWLVIADILQDGWRRSDWVQWSLGAWLLLATPISLYYHLPSKYLVASAPAVALLLARRMVDLPGTRQAFSFSVTALAGITLGLLIASADAAAAGHAREVAEIKIKPRVRAGETVWFSGQWSLYWYARNAGARVLTDTPPHPAPGDPILVGVMEGGTATLRKVGGAKLRLLEELSYREPGGRIMGSGAGFYHNDFGILPWTWGNGEVSRYEVWTLE